MAAPVPPVEIKKDDVVVVLRGEAQGSKGWVVKTPEAGEVTATVVIGKEPSRAALLDEISPIAMLGFTTEASNFQSLVNVLQTLRTFI